MGEVEEFAKRLENYLRYGNPRGPKRSMPITQLSFCPLKLALSLRFDVRYFGTKNDGQILGTVLHAGLMDTIVNSWDYLKGNLQEKPLVEVPVQYELEDGWVLSGRADLVVGKHVFEFKFLHEYPYEGIPEGIEGPDEIPDDSVVIAYVEQLNAYLHMLPNVEVGHLWVFNRNSLVPWKKIPVKKDEEMFKELLQRARDVINLVEDLENGEVPERPEPRFGWECKNCIFRPICSAITERAPR
ncbi:hypothetical protein E3E51_11405 [Thermococcus sp. 21S7]|nr:hypothetical protein [Thermococcus sp. 21S7]